MLNNVNKKWTGFWWRGWSRSGSVNFFFVNAMKTFSSDDGLQTSIARDAGCPVAVALFPLIDEVRLPYEGPAQ